MSETKITADHSVKIHGMAIDTFRECQQMIHDAYNWAYDPANYWDAGFDSDDAIRKQADNAKLALEMELSFLRNWSHITAMPITDGGITISRDGPGSFFWRYESGYHGGLIAHKNHATDGPIFSWSLHT
jgi:hypothetical protein